MSDIKMAKIDSETGEEIPSSPEEQAEALKAIQDCIANGRVLFSEEAIAGMEARGLTREVIESWFFDRKQ